MEGPWGKRDTVLEPGKAGRLAKGSPEENAPYDCLNYRDCEMCSEFTDVSLFVTYPFYLLLNTVLVSLHVVSVGIHL